MTDQVIDLLLYAQGWKTPKDEEKYALQYNRWIPTNKDFAEVAMNYKDTKKNYAETKYLPVTKITDIAFQLEKIRGMSLNQLGLLGHSDGDSFAFSGNWNPSTNELPHWDVQNESLTEENLKTVVGPQVTKKLKEIEILDDAKLVLYGCRSSGYTITENFLYAVRNTFGMETWGFRYPICAAYETDAGRKRITSRGWVKYGVSTLAEEGETIPLLPPEGKDLCFIDSTKKLSDQGWTKNIFTLSEQADASASLKVLPKSK